MATRLAEYLGDHGLSQTEFAQRVGIPEPMICQWVNGTRRPGRTNANVLERATGGVVPADYWDEVTVVAPRRRRARRPRRVKRTERGA